jgi:hypothetical protein
MEVWNKDRVWKEVNLVWQMFHKALAMNVWKNQISVNPLDQCPVRKEGTPKTIVHCFWSSQSVQQVWIFMLELLKLAANQGRNPLGIISIQLQQVVFGEAIQIDSSPLTILWLLL